MTISIHGGEVTITAQEITIHPTLLTASLDAHPLTLPLGPARVTRTPSSILGGVVQIGDDPEHTVTFPPNSDHQIELFFQALEAAKKGELAAIANLDFCGIDVETANSDWGSICQVGLARVRDGLVVETKSWLCQPAIAGFDEFNKEFHGITEKTVATAPPFAEILPEVIAWVADDDVVAHNAQFDMTAFFRAAAAAQVDPPQWNFACSLAAARSCHLPIASHKLNVVADHLNVDLEHHHDALCDAKACAEIFAALTRLKRTSGSLEEVFMTFGFERGSLNSNRVYPVLRASLASAPVPKESTPRKSQPWAKVATPEKVPDTNTEADPRNPLYGHVVTLTGDFDPFDKGLLWQKIAAAGATVAKNVTKKTTLLVIGPWNCITTKQKRAEDLNDKGQAIAFWTAQELFDVLGLDANLNPPF
ncbi:exonuclease domain-containing protein [Corynebacterium sp. ES2730-CONJ]|uniref:exonuclease domain-containing protein n=1 Tax=Corynebacterium sp. ES2730-CONJ TaxID=2973941 RepID=UPI00216ACA20|nr:exonuclease domain-containing protein [Corynebacterium sp. ES2730-CONJ]MCS4531262.1 exonuclease domain-containing protein [Corynebacterium sp. ES2730-CONJ]